MSAGEQRAARAGGFQAAPALNRTAWLAERRRGLGASDLPAVLGVSPWASPWSVWVDKVGLASDDDEPTDPMQLGLDLEPVIVAWFERRRRGLHVVDRQRHFEHPTIPWALATPDGLVIEVGGDTAIAVFESKYDAGTRWDEIPEHYWVQVQWQMFVTGLDHAFIATMHLAFGHPRFEIYEVARDQRAIDRMARAAERFWMHHVVTGTPPPADGHPATSAALAATWLDPVAVPAVALGELVSVVDELRELRAARKHLDADITRDENLLKAALGCHTEGVVDGQVVVSWRPQDRHGLDTRALAADHPDLAERYVRVTQQRVLRLHTPRTRRTA